MTESTLVHSELTQITAVMTEQRQRKVRSRKSIQKGGAVTVEQARKKIHDKKVKEQVKEQAKEMRERKRMLNIEHATVACRHRCTQGRKSTETGVT